ncbi:MAG TPA: SCP2 sterol-binding domain-containing protein [Candidatus Dormibacteraeota bacterium]|nr:SCP2 sterol-binding domain-containing protein [Candidatus Dormibacteraeota bacterium]
MSQIPELPNVDDVTPDLVFEVMPSQLIPERAAGLDATFRFDLGGEQGGTWWVKVADGRAESGRGEVANPSVTLSADARDYVRIALGELDPVSAFMGGRLRIKGDMGLAIKLQTLFRRPQR